MTGLSSFILMNNIANLSMSQHTIHEYRELSTTAWSTYASYGPTCALKQNRQT